MWRQINSKFVLLAVLVIYCTLVITCTLTINVQIQKATISRPFHQNSSLIGGEALHTNASLTPIDDLWITQKAAHNSSHEPRGLISTVHLLQLLPVSWMWKRRGSAQLPSEAPGCLSHYILWDSCMLMCTRGWGQQQSLGLPGRNRTRNPFSVGSQRHELGRLDIQETNKAPLDGYPKSTTTKCKTKSTKTVQEKKKKI